MTIETHQREDGKLIGVSGQSRWGKSEWLKKQIAHAPRVLVRDPRGEYSNLPGFVMVKSVDALAMLLRDASKKKARIAFWAGAKEFSAWAELAYNWGMLWPSVIVNEEAADVTSSGKAAGEWGELVRKGLYYGNHIYSVVQRAQETDKTTWGNPTVIHTHGFVAPDDQAYMARRSGVPVEVIAALKKYWYLEKFEDGTYKVFDDKGKPVNVT